MALPIFAALGLVKGGLAIWKWIAIAVAIAALLGTIWYAKHKYDQTHEQIGYERAVQEYKPRLEQALIERDAHLANLEQATKINKELVDVNKQTIALYATQEKALEDAHAVAINAQARTKQTLALIAERTKSYDARIVELLQRARDPVMTGENVCEEADSISRGVMRERVRNNQ